MKWKLWLNIITLGALGAIIFFAWGDITKAVDQALHLNVWVLALLVPLQLGVFWAMAKMFEYFLKATDSALPAKKLFSPMMELNFVNHVFPSGGVSGFSYLTFRLKSHDINATKSTLAQLGRFVFTFVVYVALLFVALLLLAVGGQASTLLIFLATAIMFSTLFVVLVLTFVIGSETRINTFTRFIVVWLNRVIRIFRPKHPETISLETTRKVFSEFHQDYLLLIKNRPVLGKLVKWTVIMCLLDLAMPYVVFLAHGSWINPGAVIIAFVTANILGYLAVLPGGVGVYEPTMVAIYLACGIPAPLALSVTLIFRVAVLLISLITGYFLYQRALHRYGKADVHRK